MSEPMPGDVPAQQDRVPADFAGLRGPAETAERAGPADPVRAGEWETPGEQRDPAGPDDPAEQSRQNEPEADDDGPRPLGLGVEPTGHAPVDTQMRRLEDADHLAVSGHLEVYEDVHRGLRETLTALDRPAPGPAPGRAVPGHPYTRS